MNMLSTFPVVPAQTAAAPTLAATPAPAQRLAIFAALVFAIAAALCLPFLRSVFWIGDEGILLHGARRLAAGKRIYIDFFELHPPLGFLATRAWLQLFGDTLASARMLTAAAVASTAMLTFVACARVTARRLPSAALALAWVVMSQGKWTQVNHHWLTTALSMAAMVMLLPTAGARPKHVLVGMVAGAAAAITTTRGALLLLAVLAAPPAGRSGGAAPPAGRSGVSRRAALLRVGGGAALVAGATMAYIVSASSIAAAFDGIVVFAATRYSDVQSIGFGYGADAQNAPLAYVFPAAGIAVLAMAAASGRAIVRDATGRTLAGFALAGFVGCYPRPDIIHVAFAAPLALPLLAYAAARLLRSGVARAALLVSASAMLLASGQGYGQQVAYAARGSAVRTAAGPVSFPHGRGEDAVVAFLRDAPANDAVFFYPYAPMLPYLTNRTQAAAVDVFVPGYSTLRQYAQACRAAMRTAAWVVLDRELMTPESLRRIFPAMRDTQPPEKAGLEAALRRGFMPAAVFGEFEVLRRSPQAAPALCAAT